MIFIACFQLRLKSRYLQANSRINKNRFKTFPHPHCFSPRRKGTQAKESLVFLHPLYEIQILDSWENPTYANGQAGSVFLQHIPQVNAAIRPGELQSYDIIFTAPEYESSCTPFAHNEEQACDGKMPLLLQDHGQVVSFRNIWLREL